MYSISNKYFICTNSLAKSNQLAYYLRIHIYIFSSMLMKKYSPCSMITGSVRIITWTALLFFGITKLMSYPEAIGIWAAAHQFWLTFLSIETWFWIAVVAEILAWVQLLFGWKARAWAVLTVIIMIFAWNFTWWNMNINAALIMLWALVVLIKWTGAWAIEPTGKCGKECIVKWCCGWTCSCKKWLCTCETWNCTCWGSKCCSKKENTDNDSEIIEA